MRVIEVIENCCECRVLGVSAYLRGGKTLLYGKEGDAPFCLSTDCGGMQVEIKYASEKEMTPDLAKFAGEMAGCLLENIEDRNFHEELTKAAGLSVASARPDRFLRQILDTIICSHLFDKAAIMLYNSKRRELRAVRVAGFPPYTKEQEKRFRAARLSVTEKAITETLHGIDAIFERLEDRKFKNSFLVSPIRADHKLYGVLITYADVPYEEKHRHASRTASRIIAAMMTASVVYRLYALSLASEKQMADRIKKDENLLALGNYAAAMVHEIKNPLISIGGFAKRLVKAINDPSLQKMANIISTESERLERLAEDILSFSKKHEPEKTLLPLLEELENIKMLFEVRSQETDIDITLHISECTVINVDRYQFRQVVVNLIANAMTAIGTNGSVTVSQEEREQFYVITIADTGGGIPEENIRKLFMPFFTTSSKGTGLGLAISKKIMTNHGGDITVRNGKNGAEFSLFLPKQ